MGYYSDSYGAIKCTQCPDQLTTIGKGAKSKDECGSRHIYNFLPFVCLFFVCLFFGLFVCLFFCFVFCLFASFVSFILFLSFCLFFCLFGFVCLFVVAIEYSI